MEFDSSLVLSEPGPRKHGQAQVDGCGIECISRLFQLESEGFVAVELARRIDQRIGQIGIDFNFSVRWRWQWLIGIPCRECPYDKVSALGHANRFRYRAGFPGK